jgi:hypothetical protein
VLSAECDVGGAYALDQITDSADPSTLTEKPEPDGENLVTVQNMRATRRIRWLIDG